MPTTSSVTAPAGPTPTPSPTATPTPTATPPPTATPAPTATPTPTPTPIVAPPTIPLPTLGPAPTAPARPVGRFVDSTFQTFTASNGLRGLYHVYAANLDPSRPVGLMVQFHGDGAYEFDHPDSTYSLGGRTGIRAQASAHNMLLLVARTPDTTGSPTWWESGSANADYARDLVRSVVLDRFAVARHRVWLIGYSGGAQFVTQYFLPRYSGLLDGGGVVVFGGGGAPRVTPAPFAADLVRRLPMHWYTGASDNGTCNGNGYDALADVQRGSAYYAARGFVTSVETPAGVCHDLSGRFGTVIGAQLDRYDS